MGAEPFGVRRLPTINLLDTRVEKTISMAPKQKLVVRANIFDILDANMITANTMLGPNF